MSLTTFRPPSTRPPHDSRRHTDRLEGTIGDNDVRRQATRHKDARINSQPAPKRQSPSEPTFLQPILDSASSFKKSIGSRKSRIRSEHQPGEKYNRDHSPAESDSTDLIKRYRPSESLSTQEWRTLSPISIHSNRLWVAKDSPMKANACLVPIYLGRGSSELVLSAGTGEPLREYAARFNHEYSRCPETNDRAAFGAFKTSQFRYLVHSSNWTTYGELMKQAAIHAKAEHFNSKGMPSASIGPSANTGQPSAPTYDRFPPHQTVSQAPYRTAPIVPAPYTTGDKRRD
ncbi:unnamed protein product, partial [Prunus brigantina]